MRIALICLAAGMNGAAHAEVRISEATVYYDISGDTADALLREMKTKAPPTESGACEFFAYTRWNARWRYSLGAAGGACRIRETDVSVDVTFTMPRWRSRSGASERLIDYWDEFERNLWLHEAGHRDIGVNVAQEIENALKSVGARKRCDALADEANAIASSLIDENDADADYDRRTRHGRKQGAYFDASAVR